MRMSDWSSDVCASDLAVDAEFVVQVRPGRQARAADAADHRALRHALALLDLAEARQVPVPGRVTAAVVEDHRAAVAALPADEGPARIAGSHPRRAGGRGEIPARGARKSGVLGKRV